MKAFFIEHDFIYTVCPDLVYTLLHYYKNKEFLIALKLHCLIRIN